MFNFYYRRSEIDPCAYVDYEWAKEQGLVSDGLSMSG